MRFPRSAAAVLLLSAVAGSGALAQSKATFGVIAGGAFSKFSGQAAKDSGFTKTRVGIAGGVFLSLGLGSHIVLEPEALYVQKGAKFETTNVAGTFKLDYIEFPVLLKLRMPGKGSPVSPHLYGGGAVGVKVACKAKGSPPGSSTVISLDCSSPDLHLQIKSTDFDLVFGAGVDVGRAMIDVRYDLGLSKIDNSSPPGDARNRTFYLLVGWAFRSPR